MRKFQINHHQAIMLFVICTISSKLQMLPCLIASDVGKDIWLVLLMFASLDAIFFALTIAINHLAPCVTIHDLVRGALGRFASLVVGISLLVYYLCTAVLPFEAVRDVFANNLFDTLPWTIFSIFFVFAVAYLSYCGMRAIGRTAELYFKVIVISVGLLLILGLYTAEIKNILPLFSTPLKDLAQCGFNHSIWFGDYMIFFVLMGRIEPTPKNRELKWTDLLIYAGCTIVYALGYVAFYSLYTVLTPTQTSLLSGISAFSILTLDVGRIDWFLVLLSQLASVISCATYIYCATDCINELTGKKNYFLCVVASVAILYGADLLLFGNIDYGLFIFKKYTRYFAIIVQTIIPLICLLCAVIYRLKCRKSNNIDAKDTKNITKKRKKSVIYLNNGVNLLVFKQKRKNYGGTP